MNNSEKNSYVCRRITDATVALLRKSDLEGISVSQICTRAEVGRNSFYRNYSSKEDILLARIRDMLATWQRGLSPEEEASNALMYASLFGHLRANGSFYLLLHERGLFDLLLTVLLEMSGPKPEHPNMAAYVTAFLAYGTFGWIKEWLGRGMQESDVEMAALLSSSGMK